MKNSQKNRIHRVKEERKGRTLLNLQTHVIMSQTLKQM